MPDQSELAKLVLELEELYPNRAKMSDGALRAYLEDLQEFSLDQVRYAIREHRRISKWFPSIAELRDLAMRYVYSDSPRDNAARRGADWNDLTARRFAVLERVCAGEDVNAELNALASEYDAADRPDGAALVRRYTAA